MMTSAQATMADVHIHVTILLGVITATASMGTH